MKEIKDKISISDLLGENIGRRKTFRERIFELIRTNYQNPVYSVAMLASDMGMSQMTLLKYIKSELGDKQTPAKLIENARLAHAKNLLTEKAKGKKVLMEDIALASGFSHTTTFSRAFKRKFNVVPSRYNWGLSINS